MPQCFSKWGYVAFLGLRNHSDKQRYRNNMSICLLVCRYLGKLPGAERLLAIKVDPEPPLSMKPVHREEMKLL